MNIIKNMEAAFLFSLSVAGVASVALDAVPQAQARAEAPAVVQAMSKADAQPGIPVVRVSAKRMTAVEKQQSLAQERARQGA